MNVRERFMALVHIPPKADACWEFIGAHDSNGYGSFRPDGRKSEKAHRVAYALFNGPLPPLTARFSCVLHRCGNGHLGCVNPDHLYLGDKRRNARDMIEQGRCWQLNRTHCPYGHPYDQTNCHVRQNGARQCRTCERDRRRVTRAMALAAKDGVQVNCRAPRAHRRRAESQVQP